nr:MAG: hypothetical protein [Bacteriophage sp.]
MRTHVLTVADRDISTDDRLLYRGTKDEDRVSLVLDDEWDGLDILVAFKGSDVVSAPAKGADGYYVIPWEVMTKIGDVSASIEGTNADGQVLLHAAMSKPFRVIETGAGFKGYEPTCDLITEAIKEAKEAASTAMASSEAADASAARANAAAGAADASAARANAAAGAANASAANADTSAHAADEAAERAAQAASSANAAAKAVELAATGLSGVQMRALVRTGDAPKVLYPGDLITAGWTWDGKTYPMRMAVAHHYTGADDAHPLKELGDGRTGNCMDLQFIDALPIAFYFEPKQAFYNNVELMSAGQYTFTVSVSSAWGTGAFGTVGQFPYTFTLAEDVPADSQWLWDAGSSSGITQIQIYAPYDGALLQTVTVAAGGTGTSLGTISELATGDFNTWARSCEGSNFWKDSAMRAWLNSDSTDWDSRRTRFTRKHPMAGKPGFLAGLEQSLRDGMASVKVKTEPHQTDGAEPVETVDMVRLPSSIEHYFDSYLGQSTEGFKAEGVVFDYWKAVAAANNHPDVIVGRQTYAWLIARDPNKVVRGVFARSAYRKLTYSANEGVVGTSGNVSSTGAAIGISCCPVLSIA